MRPSAGVWSRMAPPAACTEHRDWVLPHRTHPPPPPRACSQVGMKAPFHHHRPQFPRLTMEVSGSHLWLGYVLAKSGTCRAHSAQGGGPAHAPCPHGTLTALRLPHLSLWAISVLCGTPSQNAEDSGLLQLRQHTRMPGKQTQSLTSDPLVLGPGSSPKGQRPAQDPQTALLIKNQ